VLVLINVTSAVCSRLGAVNSALTFVVRVELHKRVVRNRPQFHVVLVFFREVLFLEKKSVSLVWANSVSGFGKGPRPYFFSNPQAHFVKLGDIRVVHHPVAEHAFALVDPQTAKREGGGKELGKRSAYALRDVGKLAGSTGCLNEKGQ
jgi:hypothetical protein